MSSFVVGVVHILLVQVLCLNRLLLRVSRPLGIEVWPLTLDKVIPYLQGDNVFIFIVALLRGIATDSPPWDMMCSFCLVQLLNTVTGTSTPLIMRFFVRMNKAYGPMTTLLFALAGSPTMLTFSSTWSRNACSSALVTLTELMLN